MNNGERPAFANPGSDRWPGSSGLTKREYFAAMALSSLSTQDYQDEKQASEMAVKFADAILKQLES